jgi:hypothetical protein
MAGAVVVTVVGLVGAPSAFAETPAPGPGILEVVAGTGSPGAPTPGPAISSDLASPYGVAVDASGDLYIADNSDDPLVVEVGGSPSVPPRLPEAPAAVLLPLAAVVVLGAGTIATRRRRRTATR